MTDKNQALPLNLFGSHTSGSSLKPSTFNVQGFGSESDYSFSRELSRATEQSQPSRNRENSPGRDSRESSTQASGNADYKSSEHRQTARSKQNANRSDRGEVSEKAEAKESRPEKTTDNGVRAESRKAETAPESNHKATKKNSEEAVESKHLKVEATYSQASGSLVGADGQSEELPDAQSTLNDIPDTSIVAAVPGNEVGVATVAKDIKGDVDVANKIQQTELGVKGDASLAHLPKRQAGLVSASMEEIEQVDEEAGLLLHAKSPKTDSVTQKSATSVGQLTSSGIVAGMTKNQTQAKIVDPVKSGIEPSVGVAKVTENTDSLASISTQRQLNENAALADARLNSQLAQENMRMQALESNQLLKRQQLQQQLLAPGASTAKVTETGNSMPDNMFLSLPGGIVTAPVLQRPDGGNAQLTNAPANLPLLQSDSDKAMASNIRWMVKENVKHAVVNVTPSGMGPISVSIGLEKDQMNISIVAVQGATREALDSMLPRLREQLSAQGHEGVKVDISDGRNEQSGARQDRQDSLTQQGDANQQQESVASNLSQQRSDNESSTQLAADSDVNQGQILIGKNGQILGGYDVYV